MKRILISVMAIVLVVGMVGAGAFAYFSDTETSSGNTFTAGTLDLKVGDTDEPLPQDGVTATWTMSNMEPGATTVGPWTINLQNSGTIAADHVEISFSHIIDDTPHVESDTDWESTPGEMARWIEITSFGYNGSLILNNLSDANGNGFIDLEDVTMSPNSGEGGNLDNLDPPPPNSGGTRNFQMKLKFNAGATNDIQGDTLTTTVTFTLNQDSSQ